MALRVVGAGLGRTGTTLAYQHEGVRPDLCVLGKALGGGVVPVSAVLGDRSVLGVLRPGEHGSTFGGNPLACAAGRAVVALLAPGDIQARALALGSVFGSRLTELVGRGLTRLHGF